MASLSLSVAAASMKSVAAQHNGGSARSLAKQASAISQWLASAWAWWRVAWREQSTNVGIVKRRRRVGVTGVRQTCNSLESDVAPSSLAAAEMTLALSASAVVWRSARDIAGAAAHVEEKLGNISSRHRPWRRC